MPRGPARAVIVVVVVALLAAPFFPARPPLADAAHTPTPVSVTIAGSLQSELGCPGDWQPECAATHLVYDSSDDVWQAPFTLPDGDWEYKAALNDSWSENYGLHATRDGANIALSLGADASVTFYYDHKTHWITDARSSVIATAPGSFQSELGCPGDWDPGCLRSWLQDPDGDGVYVFETRAIPPGSYEAKVAIGERWDENYGQGGVRDGPNIPFSVPSGATVTFRYDATSHVLTVTARGAHGRDGNVEWDGLRHDSRDLLYRTPGGAVPAGTPVTIRLRTFHDDVTAVKLRVYDLNANAQHVSPMTRVASDVSCYQPGLESESCDFWAHTLGSAAPNNLWYRFLVSDGPDTDFYADDTRALDGGLGRASDEVIDNSYALMLFDPAFAAPAWASNAVIYQIFPDRFRNGDPRNDPRTGDTRYDEPVVARDWNALPEGYCRGYDTACAEGPRGRDYFGGDLDGVTERLDYLKEMGVTAIYFNPIFTARSNHRYDTASYRQIDPALGTLKDFTTLVAEASKRGIRVILDGVFNHMSSDSPFFDRYGHYEETGACESAGSQWREWFRFRAPSGSEPSPCAPSTSGGHDTYYDGWFGFDSIPVLDKTNPEVQRFFVTSPNSISRQWLRRGASGWRLDVSGDPSFPNGYWEAFRAAVKAQDPETLIIGELWQKDSTLLRHLRGDRADSTMNYRLRDAVLGLLAPGAFDGKGFGDSGRSLTPGEAAARLASIYEDYPPPVAASLMNLLDSHDTARLLWQLTPGGENRAAKEEHAANLSEGKQRLRLASLIQFTLPGAPTIYYGDEVGVTGDDDPDDRRTYPWTDRGGTPDTSLLAHYRDLAGLRRDVGALTNGDLRMLHADDAAGALAYGRKTSGQAAVVAVNRSGTAQTLSIPVAGFVPEGVTFAARYGSSASTTVSGGELDVTLGPLSGALLVSGAVDLEPPAAPSGLHATGEGNGQVGLAWDAVAGAAAYDVYRSPVAGGGYVKANGSQVTGTSFTDTGLRNARSYYYVVRALDPAGNASGASNEISAMPHLAIGWANLQWPPTLRHTISVTNRTDNVYGQVWIDGATNQPGPTETLRAQVGSGPRGSDPAGNPAWTWVEAGFNVDAGNNDEFRSSLLPESSGEFDYAYRYTTTDGREWTHADLDGIGNGYSPSQAGRLIVESSGDTTPPATPTGLRAVAAAPSRIDLEWDAVSGDPSLYGYEIRRADASAGPYATLALVTGTSFADGTISEGRTYYYVVRAVDASFNRSADSAPASVTAALRRVTLTFTVTVPPTTDATGRTVHIAGFLDRLDGGHPQWDPGATVLTRVDATTWTIGFTGTETTELEYKYTLGDWEHVEKDAGCGEIPNRQLTLTYGDGTQRVHDTVANWRNVAPCGN